MRNAKSAGISKPRVEGDETSDWILIDFFDVVVHIMNKESREFYKIEQLWNEAVFYKFNSETGKFRKDSSYTKKQLPTN
jgi:ribosomal silencing factor RsfS